MCGSSKVGLLAGVLWYLGKTGTPPFKCPLPPAHLLPAGTFSTLFRTFPSTILPIFKTTRFFFHFCYFDWTMWEKWFNSPHPLFLDSSRLPWSLFLETSSSVDCYTSRMRLLSEEINENFLKQFERKEILRIHFLKGVSFHFKIK